MITTELQSAEHKIINIKEIVPGYNPRSSLDIDEDFIKSIKSLGILEPLLVRPKEGKYEIIAGHRRLKAAESVGITEIPALVRDLDDEQAEHIAYIDNKERKDYTPIDEACHFAYMKEKHGWSLRDMEKAGYGDHTIIRHKIGLLTLPERVAELLARANSLTERHCRHIVQLCDREKLTKIFAENRDNFIVPENWESEEEQEYWRWRLNQEIKYRQDYQIKLAEQTVQNEWTAKSLEIRVRELKEELDERMKKIKEEIEEGKKLNLIMDGIYFKSSADMKELQENSVGVVITSPPYLANKEYEEEEVKNHENPIEWYKDLLHKSFKECYRALMPGSYVCLNINDIPNINTVLEKDAPSEMQPIAEIVHPIMKEIGFRLKDIITWKKDDPWRNNPHVKYEEQEGCYRILPSREYVFLYQKPGTRKITPSQRIDSSIAKEEWAEWASGLWNIPSVRKNDDHPAKYPDELVRRLVKMYSFKGDIVLDPFLGSGTTVKVARELDRKGVGYEINEKYKPAIHAVLSSEE
ncbi:MAG: hypothetical protein AVO34_06860 [Firmicutes bacterium ML8_F2]|jgi:ParB/RepB/Spo0J family partition protein|nr:MAG: hypothetical protein AVO34_06860 [Firmicutes bacterium ML8_F2]